MSKPPEISFVQAVRQDQLCEWCLKGRHDRCTKKVSEFVCCCGGESSLQKIATVGLNDDLERRFRKKVIERFGEKKGALSEALDDAIEEWLDAEEKTKKG